MVPRMKVSTPVLWFIALLCAGSSRAAEPQDQAANPDQAPAHRAQKPAELKAAWRVAYKEGRLNVIAHQAPLAPLMREVSRCTGVEILGLDKLKREISIQFSNLALAEGLRRLLAEVDHVFISDQPTDAALPRRVLVLGAAKDVDRHLAATQPEDDGVSGPADEQKEAEKRLETLERSASAGDLQAMREALLDPDPLVQTRGLELLAEADREEAAAQLLEMTRSDERPVRMQALNLLNESEVVDEKSIVSSLGRAVTDPALSDTQADKEIKQFAIEALAERGGSKAMAYLKEALLDPDPKIRRLVLESAAPYDEKQVLLKQASLDDDEEVRAVAAAWMNESNGETKAVESAR